MLVREFHIFRRGDAQLTEKSKASMDAFALIKFFSEEKHFQWFKDGYTMFRTPHFYRRCEDIGRGDRNESCILYRDKELGDEMPILTMNHQPLDLGNIESMLLHCANEVSDSWMQSWCIVGKFNDFELSLTRMLEEFGCHFVVLQASNIKNYAESLRQASGLDVSYGYLSYSDNPLDRSLCAKDKEFEYQKEFRFYVGSCDKYEVLDKELRVSKMSNLLSGAKSLKFTSQTGDVRYCSLGSNNVV